MKKIIQAVALTLGVGVSGFAMAVTPITFSNGNHTVTTDDTDCPMLESSVTLGASSNVHGGYGCDETLNIIKVAACHEGGSRAKGVQCAYLPGVDGVFGPNPAPDGPNDDILNSSGCTDQMVIDSEYSTIPNYTAFVASSSGGSMLGAELEGRCADASLGAITFWE